MADDVTLRLGAEVQDAVAKLEQAQKKVAAMAAEAKGAGPAFDAMGTQASKATGQVTDGAGRASASFSQMVGAFAAASLLERAGEHLLKLATAAFESAGQLKDLQATTGLSTEFLQRMAFVARSTGGDVSKYADAVYKMGINIAKGGEETKTAVRAMGISWEEFRRLSPDKQVEAIVDNIDAMSVAGERNAALQAIAGRGVSSVIVGLVSDYKRLADQAIVTGDAEIEALDRLGDQWDRSVAQSEAGARRLLGAIALGAEGLKLIPAALALSLASGENRVSEFYAAYMASLEGTSKRVADLNDMERRAVTSLLEQGHAVRDVAQWTNTRESAVQALSDALVPYTERLAKEQTALAALTKEQKGQLAAGFELGVSTDDLTRSFGLSAAAIDLFKKQQEAATRATEEAAKKAQERKEALDRVRLADVAVTEAVRQSILTLDAKGVADRDIAIATGAHEVQIRRVIEAEKARQKEIEATVKAEADAAKAQADIAAATRKRIQDDGVARLEQAASLHQALIESERALELAQSEGLDRRLLELQYAERYEIAALHRTHDATEASTQQVEALIRARYKLERDQATAAASDIVERMRQQGVLTRTEQQRTVDSLKRDYDQMVASGEYSYEQLEEAERRWREAQAQLANESLTRFIGEFQSMLGIADAAFNAIGGLGNETAAKIGAVGKRIVDTASMGGEAMAAFATGDWVQGAIKSVQAIGTALQGLFKGNETKKAREEFADSMGMTLDGLYQKLQSMGAEGQRLANQALNVIGKHDEAGNKRWMNEVSTFFASHEEQLARERALVDEATLSWQEAEGIMREFGISAANSGRALEQAKLAEQGDDIAVKWRQLIAAGVDFQDVTQGMADEVQALLNRSLELGIELPASLQQPIAKMIEMGLLTDQNGNKLEGMGKLTFAESLTDKVGALVDKLDLMLRKVFGIGGEAEEAERRASKAFLGTKQAIEGVFTTLTDQDVWRTWADTAIGHVDRLGKAYSGAVNAPAGGGEGGTVPQFATGSNGIQDFGTRTLAWLHGREGVFTEDQIANLVANAGQLAMREAAAANLANWAGGNVGGGSASGGRQSISITNNISVDATNSILTRQAQMKDLAYEIKDAFVDLMMDQGVHIRPTV